MDMFSSDLETRRTAADDAPFALELLSERVVQLSAQVQQMSEAAARTEARLSRIEEVLGLGRSPREAGFDLHRDGSDDSAGFDDAASHPGWRLRTQSRVDRFQAPGEHADGMNGSWQEGIQSESAGFELTLLMDRFVRAYLGSDALRADQISRNDADLEDQKKQLAELRDIVVRLASGDSQAKRAMTSLELRVSQLLENSEWMQEKLNGQDRQLQQVVNSTESWLSLVTQVASTAAQQVTRQAEKLDQFGSALERVLGGAPRLRNLREPAGNSADRGNQPGYGAMTAGAAAQSANQKAAVAL
jgi:hypothetical protein